MALIAASIFTLSASAQQPACNQDKKCDAKCRSEKKCDAQKKCAKACNPFEGLNLTEQQQTSLKAIPTPCEVMKAAKKTARDNSNEAKNLEPGKRAQLVKTVRADYLKQVKQVLTPEQYTQFLENAFVNQRPAKADKHHGHRKDFKNDKAGKHKNPNAKKQECCKNK